MCGIVGYTGRREAQQRADAGPCERHSGDGAVHVVDARNAVAIRWLGWLGFTLGAPQPMGVRGLPFIPFIKSTP